MCMKSGIILCITVVNSYHSTLCCLNLALLLHVDWIHAFQLLYSIPLYGYGMFHGLFIPHLLSLVGILCFSHFLFFKRKCSWNMYKNFSRLWILEVEYSVLWVCIFAIVLKFVKIVFQNNFTYLLNSCFFEYSLILYIVIIFHFYQAKNMKLNFLV